jgi:hypothetical protein
MIQFTSFRELIEGLLRQSHPREGITLEGTKDCSVGQACDYATELTLQDQNIGQSINDASAYTPCLIRIAYPSSTS